MAKIFISYAREDAPYQKLLRRFLVSADGGDHSVEAISDEDLLAGDLWEKRLNSHIAEADAGVVLLSTYFLGSVNCMNELTQMASRGPNFPLIPIVVGPCPWDEVPELKERNAICSDKPAGGCENQESLWFEIATRVRRTLRKTQERPWPMPEDEWGRISKAIKNGLFTPILGPGCYEVTEDTREARQHLRNRLEWVLAKLGDDVEACGFIRGVVASNLESVLKSRIDQLEEPKEDWMGPLIDLQAALARLGAACCCFMGEEMQHRPFGFTDVRAVAVNTAAGLEPVLAKRIGLLRDAFFSAVRQAELLNVYIREKHHSALNKGFGSTGILGQLVILTYSIFYDNLRRDDADDRAREWLDEYRDLVATADRFLRQARKPIASKLALAQLEWIGDLVWHTLRFEAPMYPSPDELAFQLSVCLGTAVPPRRERMGALVELANEELRQKLIRKFFKAYESGASGRSKEQPKLYEVLARALLFASRRAERLVTRRRGSAGEAQQERVTVAISTNFDRELERALDKAECIYHLVFPVLVPNDNQTDGVGEDYRASWMIRTVSWDDGERATEDVFLDPNSIRLNEHDFRGPVLVKLHGSPLEPLQGRYLHRLWISDRDFIEAMVARDRFWPRGLRELLDTRGRVLCFVGYPLGDTGSRLRLSEHLKQESDNRALYLFDYPEDPLRHALLKRIRVSLIPTKIDELPQLLLNLLDQTPERESGIRS